MLPGSGGVGGQVLQGVRHLQSGGDAAGAGHGHGSSQGWSTVA